MVAVERKIGRRSIDAAAGKVFDFAGKRFNPGDLIEIKSYERIDRLRKELSGHRLRDQIQNYLDYLEPGKKLVVIFKNRTSTESVDDFLRAFKNDVRLEVVNGVD